ncbi:4815_t:CDS:2, partial [Cetraspora pellucida]
RTIRDVNIFNNFVKNKDEREYVDKKVIETDHLEFYKIVYVDPPLRTTTRHKKKRSRHGETCSNEYLKQLYDLYETSIDTIYPEHVKFDNKIVLCKNCIDFKLCQKKCDHSLVINTMQKSLLFYKIYCNIHISILPNEEFNETKRNFLVSLINNTVNTLIQNQEVSREIVHFNLNSIEEIRTKIKTSSYKELLIFLDSHSIENLITNVLIPKLQLLESKFLLKYSYETFLSLHDLNMTRLRKKELNEWLNQTETKEEEQYFKINFLHTFNYLDRDVEQIYDSIDKTFGHNFITINDQSDFSLKNNHDSPALVINEFVWKK